MGTAARLTPLHGNTALVPRAFPFRVALERLLAVASHWKYRHFTHSSLTSFGVSIAKFVGPAIEAQLR